MEKSQWRSHLRAMLRAMYPAQRAAASAEICAALATRVGDTALAFRALPTEPDLWPLMQQVATPVFPRVDGERLRLFVARTEADFEKRGILREPIPERCQELTLAEIPLILVPGLAFDPVSKKRLGQGGGYYDRLLSHSDWRGRSIGICFANQVVPGFPTEAHDCAVDEVISAGSSEGVQLS